MVLEMESTPRENVVKIIEMTSKDLEYNMNLLNKAVAGFKRINANFERSSTVGKMPSNSIACYRETVCERKSIDPHFKKCPQPPHPSAATTLMRQLPSTPRQDPPLQKIMTTESSDDG